jgi:hypothetical protein
MCLVGLILIPLIALKLSNQWLKKNKHLKKKYYIINQIKYHKSMTKFYENKL